MEKYNKWFSGETEYTTDGQVKNIISNMYYGLRGERV